MEYKIEYLQKYLDDAAIDQIADEYADKGYRVSKHEQIGKSYADLVARKDNEAIFIEVNSGKLTPQKKEAIAEISKLVKTATNYKFLVVLAPPPKEKKLEVSNIEELLENYMLHHPPDGLDELSVYTKINKVFNVRIDEITIQQNGLVFVKGWGAVNIKYAVDADQVEELGPTVKDNFGFYFEVTLQQDENKNFRISEVSRIKMDKKSYYPS